MVDMVNKFHMVDKVDKFKKFDKFEEFEKTFWARIGKNGLTFGVFVNFSS